MSTLAPTLQTFFTEIAGSENFDHTFSGNSGHLPIAVPGQKIVGDSATDEGKDDRDAQATRDSGIAPRGSHLEGGRRDQRDLRPDGSPRRRGTRGHDGR